MWKPRRDSTLRLECDNHAAVFNTFRGKAAIYHYTWEVTVPRVLLLWTFHMQSRKSLIWKGIPVNAAVSITRCAYTTSMACFQKPKLGILSFHCALSSTFLSPDVYGSLTEGINVCTQRDEWLNLDLGCTEWGNRQSLQKALWWKRDNLQASSSLVRWSNCMTRVEWRTDMRKKSTGIWQLMGRRTLLWS